MRILDLQRLKNGEIPGLSQSVGAFLTEAAIVCLTQNGHQSGVMLKVTGEFSAIFQLTWTDNSDENTLLNWKDLNETVEYGATALALLLIEDITEYSFFARASQMDTADYLLNKKGVANDFEQLNPSAYLEVSGIWKERSNNAINMRVNIKKKQLGDQTDNPVPIFIVVTEFGEPKSKILKV